MARPDVEMRLIGSFFLMFAFLTSAGAEMGCKAAFRENGSKEIHGWIVRKTTVTVLTPCHRGVTVLEAGKFGARVDDVSIGGVVFYDRKETGLGTPLAIGRG